MPNDPYKYFRVEARELLDFLARGVLDLEKGDASKDLIGRLLRQAHTLKGAARIVNQAKISELSHRIEDVLAPHREGERSVPPAEVSGLLSLLDEIAAALAVLDSDEAETEPRRETPKRAHEDVSETIRVDASEMDEFLHGISQVCISQNALKKELVEFDGLLSWDDEWARSPEVSRENSPQAEPARQDLRLQLRRLRQKLLASAEKAERELFRLQDRASQLRLLPAGTLFGALERAARDAAGSLSKKVDFKATGAEIRLDAHVLRALQDALAHIVRNAVAHGIEAVSQRVAAGKAPAGLVQFSVKRRGDRVVFSCADDGRGIDVDQVGKASVKRGMISAGEVADLNTQGAIRLLLQGGISTTQEVTEVSGRGVGLDIVRETTARLKGEITASTERGRGTVITLSVPVSLEALSAIEVEVDGTSIYIPFGAIACGLRVPRDAIARSLQGDSLLFDGKAIPFVPLARLLRPASAPALRPRVWSVLIMSTESGSAAVGIDRVLRRTNIVIRPLPRLAGSIDLISGACFDVDGNAELVIDPVALVRLIGRGVRSSIEEESTTKLPLLVIDDSLTTRMLEQSILERAGYDVDLAVSGEEGLKKARQKPYAMFIVDVEMPGIDGFEFIETVKADLQLRNIPSILVTSRASMEDRRRGEQAGALAYIVKSEFDEGHLLATIRRLIG